MKPGEALEANAQARAFALDYIQKTPLGLPSEMTDEDFEKVMNAITRAIVTAFAAGYLARAEKKR